MMNEKNINDIYEEYVNNCEGIPKGFPEFLITYSKILFYRQHIRPMMIWWQSNVL